MASDTTRRALEAAARALCCGDECGCEIHRERCFAWQLRGEKITIAITAYLRAKGRDSEAAAVERAAKEKRDA